MIDSSTVFFLIILVIILILWKLSSKPPKFPPGPFRWPVVGSLLSVRGRYMHEVAGELADKYGEVSGLFLGSRSVVILSGVQAIKEASTREDLSGRPVLPQLQLNHGLLFNYGSEWREQRRFTLRHLRDLGLGKRTMEGIIHEEVHALLDQMKLRAGENWSQPVPLQDVLGIAGINVLWHIMAGERYSHYDDSRLRHLVRLVTQITGNNSAAGRVATFFPALTRLFPKLMGLYEVDFARAEIDIFLKEHIRQHRETLDVTSPRDFLDIYLTEIENQKNDVNSSFTDLQLLETCGDLFAAGADTSFNTMTFALMYMVRFPRVQKLVQDEIDRVVGKDRLPELQDQADLVYTEATIFETFRMSSVVPLAVPHATPAEKHDVHFRGYVIPKESRVLLNLAHLHMDSKIWGDPQNFRPERFITSDNKLIRHTALLPFGIGKRQCPGESLARNNVILFFSAIMQRYSLSVPPGEQPPSLEVTGAFTLSPKPFNALVTPRFSTV